MTLDATSHATLADVKREGCVAVRAYDSLILCGTTGGGGFVHCVVGVAWEVWSHATSVIVIERVKPGGGGRNNVERVPQRPVGQINVMRLTSRVS